MAIDAYVKFGTTKEHIGPHNNPRAAIDGDSTDADHYWWCELRDCGFDLKNPHTSSEDREQSDDEVPASHFDPVTLRKRVDWATTQLFTKCCQASEATWNRASADADPSQNGIIDEVEVHVCRPVGGFQDTDPLGNPFERLKIPVVSVIYRNVRITHFQITIDDPEPAEEIKFEFDEIDYCYQPTDPDTGMPRGDLQKVIHLQNHKLQETPSGSGQSPATTSGSSGGGGGAGATVVTAGGGGAQSGSSNGSSSTLVTTTESIALANVPGLLPLNGQGTLS